ncbi:MAG TPA: radical SAM family heme chaperone HemW, partial [Alphaproteobacteria bacterium]|nr:radical SAM family heme chaperone HemW [Alphaproteobacteria bacterium]
FNSHVAGTVNHDAWREAYTRAFKHYAQLLPGRQIASIFFGGGTPSLMETKTVESILQTIAQLWALDGSTEITLEANPTSVEAQKFKEFRAAGVNRLSLGVQSLRADALKFLGREHSADQAKAAIELAAQNFPHFSFDLIYARKDQTLTEWEKELREGLALAGDHLSLYQLTIEPNTQFYTLANRGEKLTAPDEDAATMFELTQDIMAADGKPAYEISNHAKPGEESRHNLTYWQYNDYIGIGPGAHGRYSVQGQRFATEDHKAPDVWLGKVREHDHGLKICDLISVDIAKREAFMMGLRLREGISHKNWLEKFGSPLSEFLRPEKIARLRSENYLTENTESLQATNAGLQRLNAVLGYLLN